MIPYPKFAFLTVIILLLCISVGIICYSRADLNEQCKLSPKLKDEIRSYEGVANRIIEEITNGKFKGHTWKMLSKFIDTFGPRMTGTETLERSIDYMTQLSRNLSLHNVTTEDVQISAWSRGIAHLAILEPIRRNIEVLALGGSVSGSAVANAVVVENFKELDLLNEDEIQGKIVIFNQKYTTYRGTVQYRIKAASKAAVRGAKAALVRSVTPKSMRTLHTGWQHYEEGIRKIPVGSITEEDAEMLHRFYKRGETIKLELNIQTSLQENKKSRNTIVNLTGTDPNIDRPIVVVSGHLDSWDVGDGAMDDGGGVMISLAALHVLNKLSLIPKRTLRAIFWTGEEQELLGAHAYVNSHSAEEDQLNYVMESDVGTFKPRGINFSGSQEAGCIIQEVLKLLKPINATQFKTPHVGGPDIKLWTDRGIPGSSLLNENEEYFWYHHSVGDSMVLEDPHNLDLCTAVWTVVSYVIADLSEPLPR